MANNLGSMGPMKSSDLLERIASQDLIAFDLDSLKSKADTDPFYVDVWKRATQLAGVDSKVEEVPVEDFCKAFFHELKDVHYDATDQLCLATIITDINPENQSNEQLDVLSLPVVTRVSFALFLLHYGPPSASLGKIRDIIIKGQSWFHGQQSREVSEKLLESQKKEKLFLLRYSSTPGCFTVDYVKNGAVCHFNNIRNDPEGGVVVTLGKPPKENSYRYSHVSAFIAKNSHLFMDACINHNSPFQWRKLRIVSSSETFKGVDDFLRTAAVPRSPKSSTSDLSFSEDDDDASFEASPRIPSKKKERSRRGKEKKEKEREKEREKEAKGTNKKKKKKLRKRAESESSKLSRCGSDPVMRRRKSDVGAEAMVKAAIEAQSNPKVLDLRHMGLTSSGLPSSLFKLTHLVSLDLSHNNLTELPEFLALLVSLESIDLTGNRVTVLDASIFSAWVRLTSFVCADNLLTELPDNLFEGGVGKRLSHLDFSSNQLTSIPSSIGRLKHKLQFLDFSSNLVHTLPKSLTKLRILEELYLKENRLKRLLPGMSAMISLMMLDVSQNDLTELPKDLYELIWANTGFVFIVDGNPSIDVKEVEAIIASGGTADPKIKKLGSKVDMFHAYQISTSHNGDSADNNNNGDSADNVPAYSQETYMGLSDNVSLIHPTFHSLWKPSEQYVLELPMATVTRPDLDLYEHFTIYDYRRYFYRVSVHTNALGTVKGLGPVCISILKEPSRCLQPNAKELECYRAFVRTNYGDKQYEIPASMVKQHKKERYARSSDLLTALKKYINSPSTPKLGPTIDSFSLKGLYVIRDASSHNQFATLEDRLKIGSYKFGVMYAKKGQTDETSMYNNASGSEGFEEFLSILGEKIELEGWQGYTGGLETNLGQKAVYLEYCGLEVLFHVCTYLPLMKKTDKLAQQWDRKRHIGNDVCLIVYYEGDEPIDPATFESQFNHVFALVQPKQKKDAVHYRLHMAYKKGVDPSIQTHPPIPRNGLFEKGQYFRDFLITKLINAERCSVMAPRFQNAAQRVRTTLFEEMQETFPKRKDKKSLLGRKKSMALLFGAPPGALSSGEVPVQGMYGETMMPQRSLSSPSLEEKTVHSHNNNP